MNARGTPPHRELHSPIDESVEVGLFDSIESPQSITTETIKRVLLDSAETDLLEVVQSGIVDEQLSPALGGHLERRTLEPDIVECERIALRLLFTKVDAISRECRVLLLKNRGADDLTTIARAGRLLKTFDASETIVLAWKSSWRWLFMLELVFS